MRTIELRNYLLKEGAAGDFIRFFEENFLFSQREEGMSVLGQFGVMGEPDRFVWIRAFESMETRRRGLGGFYGGPAWKAHGPTANGMMLEFHNVHLLRPLAPIADLTGGLSLEDRAAEPAGALPPHTGLVAVDFYRSEPGGLERLIELFARRLRPALVEQGARVLGHFVAELAPNDYPGLPVYQNENLLVVLSAYRDREHHAALKTSALPATDVETMLLRPTARSVIRY
ncbi:MAG: NIPSNAP family protein [Thermoanaerobaculia bacterium]